jgi:hypothetical protein
LEPGGNPSSNDGIFESCDMYFKDLELSENNYIDIVADESIFQRVIQYKDNNAHVRPILGQWHLNKDMCSILITIFSSYGIFEMASILGVKFLDKLESVIDYRSTCRVLEIIWTAVGISIHIYLKKYEIEFDNVMNGTNNLLKVWYLFFCWAGLWKAHKIGIRTGNFDMQHKSLKAFAPLFPIAGKYNYTRSVVYYLAELEKHPQLQQLFTYAASVNISRKDHYMAYDEALETYGVKFIKQNVSGRVTDEENLKLQIKSAQSESDRIDMLLWAFVDDPINQKNDRAIISRREVTWNLALKLENAFEYQNPLESELFIYCTQLTEEGYKKLFLCMCNGKDRMETLFR